MAAIELYSTPLISDANLVAYYRLEGNANDSKGTNNGTEANITYSAANGNFGQGGGFNGSSSKSTFSTTTWAQAGDFSVSFWINTSTTDYGSYVHCFFQNATDNGFYGWNFFTNTNSVCFRSGNTGAGTTEDLSAGTINNGAWHHIVGTYVSSSKLKTLYIDGSSAGTQTASQGIAYTNSVASMGAYYKNGSVLKYYTGKLDDIAIFSRVLTATEISNLYNGTWTSIKKVGGVAYASIKKISGVAIASVKKVGGVA